MPSSLFTPLSIIAVTALVTIFCRALPFVLFRDSRRVPQAIIYLGQVLPFAIIPLLVVYCFRGTSFSSAPFGAPELIAGALVIGIHIWKRNNLLSIGISTLVYMLMVQHIFV